MKIIVRSPDLSFPIRLVFPLSALKWKWIWKMAERYASERERENVRMIRSACENLYDALRESERYFGHYNLVEITSADGEEILIQL